ncbi:MAG: DNA integrity scanning protein DisA nucleotide-binding domain protein [Deltaproteobacteria bacterium]|nr:DNA integrity scanning protein DisA nucleotide-binding domain protein [Deltaproteobacteria bacterium]
MGSPLPTAKTPVQTIAGALYELAQRHIGALIVFPGKDDLEEVIRSGKSWHGLVSKEMIMSIFWHDNPVHYGAPVIQGDQVTHVGLILPLLYRDDPPSH